MGRHRPQCRASGLPAAAARTARRVCVPLLLTANKPAAGLRGPRLLRRRVHRRQAQGALGGARPTPPASSGSTPRCSAGCRRTRSARRASPAWSIRSARSIPMATSTCGRSARPASSPRRPINESIAEAEPRTYMVEFTRAARSARALEAQHARTTSSCAAGTSKAQAWTTAAAADPRARHHEPGRRRAADGDPASGRDVAVTHRPGHAAGARRRASPTPPPRAWACAGGASTCTR